MKNLLDETIEFMNKHNHSRSDIRFIGSADGVYECSWNEFIELADKEYDEGYGYHKVVTDLIIEFIDGDRMTRWEYDGAEGWFFTPSRRLSTKKIVSLFAEDYEWTLDELHKDK